MVPEEGLMMGKRTFGVSPPLHRTGHMGTCTFINFLHAMIFMVGQVVPSGKQAADKSGERLEEQNNWLFDFCSKKDKILTKKVFSSLEQ